MTTNARWIFGLLIVLVLGLGIALAVATGGDDGGDGGETVTLPTITGGVQTQPTTTSQQPTTTATVPTTPTESSGGVSPP